MFYVIWKFRTNFLLNFYVLVNIDKYWIRIILYFNYNYICSYYIFKIFNFLKCIILYHKIY